MATNITWTVFTKAWKMPLPELGRFIKGMGFDVGKSETAVIPLYVRQDLRTVMMWKELLDVHGIYCNPFITPGVPPKQSLLRTSYMATHTRAHLDKGLEAFRAVGKKFGVI